MNYKIKKYQSGNLVTAPELLPPVKNKSHWSEKVPESWDWIKPHTTEPDTTEWTADLIKRFEGFREGVYKDGKGLPTIGYGTRDKKYLAKGKISEEEASAKMNEFIKTTVEPTLKNKSYYPNLSANKKVALKSLIYNIGPTKFNNSVKLQQALTTGNWDEAMRQMDHGMTDKDNPGLALRRKLEQQIFNLDTR